MGAARGQNFNFFARILDSNFFARFYGSRPGSAGLVKFSRFFFFFRKNQFYEIKYIYIYIYFFFLVVRTSMEAAVGAARGQNFNFFAIFTGAARGQNFNFFARILDSNFFARFYGSRPGSAGLVKFSRFFEKNILMPNDLYDIVLYCIMLFHITLCHIMTFSCIL